MPAYNAGALCNPMLTAGAVEKASHPITFVLRASGVFWGFSRGSRFPRGNSLFILTIAAWTALSRGPPLAADGAFG